jgi:hypothetical protein
LEIQQVAGQQKWRVKNASNSLKVSLISDVDLEERVKSVLALERRRRALGLFDQRAQVRYRFERLRVHQTFVLALMPHDTGGS